jgi:hypothetical protein
MVHQTDKRTALIEPIIYKIRDPRHLRTIEAPTACYGYSFMFLYVEDVCTIEKTHPRASTAWYGDRVTFYIQIMFVSHTKHASEPPIFVTGIALIFICRRLSYHTGNTTMGLHGLLRGYSYFLYADDVRASQETPPGHKGLLRRELCCLYRTDINVSLVSVCFALPIL